MNSSELTQLNNSLIAEAQAILYKDGLWDVLSKYGVPSVTGSFVLKTMAYRDLDLYLESDTISEAEFFDLGRAINTALKPARMSYRNEFRMKTPNLPMGFYWGVYTDLESRGSWRIDIWTMSHDQIINFKNRLEETMSKITEENRLIILDIKNRLSGRKERISSMIIYRAVLDENVHSMLEFKKWVKQERGMEIE
ncbi:MAG: hypothetical protein Q8Q41_02760 [bacterium]|nr:hypothetical protein [bacterium]